MDALIVLCSRDDNRSFRGPRLKVASPLLLAAIVSHGDNNGNQSAISQINNTTENYPATHPRLRKSKLYFRREELTGIPRGWRWHFFLDTRFCNAMLSIRCKIYIEFWWKNTISNFQRFNKTFETFYIGYFRKTSHKVAISNLVRNNTYYNESHTFLTKNYFCWAEI